MKRLVAVFMLVAVMLISANTAEAGRFGVKAGVNVTSLDFEKGLPGALGYSAGITWQWDLPLGFAIQPDLVYHVKATRLSNITKETFGLGYVELPVNLQWGLRFADKNIRVFAQATPFVGYAVSQKGSLVTASDSGQPAALTTDTAGPVDKWKDINRYSYGAGVGLGIQLWALQLTAQYNWSFGNISNIKNTSLNDFNDSHFSGYTITMALMFGGKKNKK